MTPDHRSTTRDLVRLANGRHRWRRFVLVLCGVSLGIAVALSPLRARIGWEFPMMLAILLSLNLARSRRAAFRTRVESIMASGTHALCPSCWYAIEARDEIVRCPECGLELHGAELRRAWEPLRTRAQRPRRATPT